MFVHVVARQDTRGGEPRFPRALEKHLENIARGGKKRGKLLCGNEVREIRVVVGPEAA